MKKLLILFISIILFNSCSKDKDFNNEQNLEQEEPTILSDDAFSEANFGDVITANFAGRVIDESGNQIKDVQVAINNQTVFTDQNGVFVVNNVSVYENFAFVKAVKSGYIDASRAIVPTINGSNDIQITLLNKNIVGVVSSGAASEVSMSNGAKVSFLGEFVDNNGEAYSGQVEVSMYYLEPNNPATFQQMPGALFGKRENGTASGMETYGMLAIDLFTPSGETLNIANNSSATLYFPISNSTPDASQNMPLWYFDAEVGYWKEQGMATIESNMYVAEVNHFTWWNCDLPLDYINGCINLTGDSELNDYYLEVIRTQNNQTIFSGFTNSSGVECGLFPANENFTIKIYDKCTQDVLSDVVYGPYSSVTTIQLGAQLIDCNSSPITNGYVWLLNGSSSTDVIMIEDGQINYSLSLCDEVDYSIVVYDLEGQKSSDLIAVDLSSNADVDLGTLSVCTDDLGLIYSGDIILETQYEVEEFGQLGYSIIDGNLFIGSDINEPSSGDEVSDLYLYTLTKVTGDLTVQYNPVLQSLNGLDNLTDVLGEFKIQENNMLTSLYGLGSLNYVGKDFTLTSNLNLATVNGLNNLQSIGGSLHIWNSEALYSLSAFTSLITIGENLHIQGNQWISNLTGFNNLNTIGKDLALLSNNSLSDLSALQSLTTIGIRATIHDNQNLTSLNGLESLTSNDTNFYIGSTTYGGNTSLVDFCAISNLVTSNTFTGNFSASQNAYNPNIYDMINGNCSQ